MDSDYHKLSDFLGACYLQIRAEGRTDQYTRQTMIGMLVDNIDLLDIPFANPQNEEFRRKFLQIKSQQLELYEVLFLLEPSYLKRSFLLEIQRRVEAKIRKVQPNYRLVDPMTFKGDDNDYFNGGLSSRNQFMAQTVHDVLCSGMHQTKRVAIVTGYLHQIEIFKFLKQMMPDYKVNQITLSDVDTVQYEEAAGQR